MFNNAKLLRQQQQKAESEITKMVAVMGTLALNHYTKTFRDQGFDGNKWVPRKINIENPIARPTKLGDMGGYRKRPERKRDTRQRALLILSGNLRRSLFKVRISRYSIKIGSPLKYALIHNEGGVIKHPAKGEKPAWQIHIPRRKFVGYSRVLNRQIIEKLDYKIKLLFK